MRKINTADVFKMARLMRSANLAESIKKAYIAGREKDTDTEEVGMNAIMDILASCCDTETEKGFYELLAGISEKAEDEVMSQSLETTITDIKRICEENNIINFLRSASSMKQI